MSICRRLGPTALLALALLTLNAACNDDPSPAPGTPEPTATGQPAPTPESIPWSDAVRLITDCDVTFVMQAHSLDVWLTLRDGSQVRAVEPRIDEVFTVVQDAVTGGCEQIPLGTE
jgi:hypothetical protein